MTLGPDPTSCRPKPNCWLPKPRAVSKLASDGGPMLSRAGNPGGHPRRLADWSRVRDWSSQRTTGARYFSRRRSISSCNAAISSAVADASAGSAASMTGIHRSLRSRRARLRLDSTAIRTATRCSQPPTVSRTHSEPALRASTRKVDWNASSASCSSLRIPVRPPRPSSRAGPRGTRTRPRRDGARNAAGAGRQASRPKYLPRTGTPTAAGFRAKLVASSFLRSTTSRLLH